MNNTAKVVIVATLVVGLGYLGMKYYYPPQLNIMSLNPLDGSGSFQWGRSGGGLGPGTYDPGWGWLGTFSSFVPGTGWTFVVTKNGAIYKTVIVNELGSITI